MDLYLIRHAEAVPLGQGGIEDDAARPLTQAGKAQCRALAHALLRLGVRLDKVVSSPLLRARQTAEGVLEHWPEPTPEVLLCDALAPDGKRRKLLRYLRDLEADAVGVVGHNPDLSVFAAWLIGPKGAQVELSKAGVAHIEFDDGRPGKGNGLLTWLVTPEWCAAGGSV
jgi:phosphohistidine phosphatase